MLNRTRVSTAISFAALMVGCGTTTTSSPAASGAAPTATATASPLATHAQATSGSLPSGTPYVHQPVSEYASGASATSNYGAAHGSSWNATAATGPPDVPTCSDDGNAWASLANTTTETLTVKFTKALTPTAVHITQSLNPGFIKTVTVAGGGHTATIYTGTNLAKQAECPVDLDIAVHTVTFPIDEVAITVAQGDNSGWAEIDAVGLSGT